MAKGRDPQPMNTSEFFWKAFATGGAAPGVAELLMDQKTRYNAGPLEAALGPLGGALWNVGELAVYAPQMAADRDGAMENFMDALESATYNVPLQNWWPARAAVQRGIRDTLLDLADPNYAESQRRSERNRRNELDQYPWWGYGDSPRMPDFAGALGD
jgi:hypothetical protein